MELTLPAELLLRSEPGSFAVTDDLVESLYRLANCAETSDGRRLDLRLISLEAPAEDALLWSPDESVEGVLARLAQQFRYPQALLILANPEEALGEEHMAHAMGCGLLAIDEPSRELCWDAALAKGLPIYGIRDELRLSLTRQRASSILSALAFGVFDCRNGTALDEVSVEDHREGVRWSGVPDSAQTVIVLREGYEIPQPPGAEGAWRDRGNEGVVRLRMRADDACLWSQPRFVMPGARGMPAAAQQLPSFALE